MTLLSFSWFFGLLVVLHGVLDLNFKLCAFCYQWTHQGGDCKTKWSVPWFDCDESLTWRGLNLSPRCFICFTFILVLRLENHVSLSCGVQVAGAAWRAVLRIIVGVGDLLQRTGNGRTGRVLGGQTFRGSDDVVCGLHRARANEESGFLG
jgi:hypothetical protein